MKICLVTTGLGIGGAEKQVCDLADMFHLDGHDVIIVSLTGKTLIQPENKSIKIYTLLMRKNPISMLSAYCELRKIIRTFEPDILHSHMLHANIFCRFLRLTTKVNVLISTAHNTYEGSKIWMNFYRYTDSLATISTNVSQASVDEFIRLHASTKRKMIAFYNGVDTNKFSFCSSSREKYRNEIGVADHDILILSVGRLTEAKNHSLLIDSFSEALKINKNLKLVIIGDGPDRHQLELQATKLGILDSFFLLGNSFNVAEWMSAADIFAMSSKWEGMPLVICEAMSTERIIISTDCGGIKEIIGKYGFLVPANDMKNYTKLLLDAITLSPEESNKLRKNARMRVVNNFSLFNVSQAWIELYRTYLNKK